MIEHECIEQTYCSCSLTALEPSEDCPFHGNPWPPRCMYCGRFLPWSIRDNIVKRTFDGEWVYKRYDINGEINESE